MNTFEQLVEAWKLVKAHSPVFTGKPAGDDLNWAMQQIRETGKPAGDIPAMNQNELADTLVIMRKNIGLRRRVRALLADFSARDIAHESVHVFCVRAVVGAVMLVKPGKALLAHEIACVAHIAHQQLFLAVKII